MANEMESEIYNISVVHHKKIWCKKFGEISKKGYLYTQLDVNPTMNQLSEITPPTDSRRFMRNTERISSGLLRLMSAIRWLLKIW